VREAIQLAVPVVASKTAARPAGVSLFQIGIAETSHGHCLESFVKGLHRSAANEGPTTVTLSSRSTRRLLPLAHDPALQESLRWASRAFEREVLGFTFEYPIEIVPAAGESGSLRYYVFSRTLFLENQEFDEFGVLENDTGSKGFSINPLFIAWWGLHHLELFNRAGRFQDHDVFLRQVQWLVRNAETRETERWSGHAISRGRKDGPFSPRLGSLPCIKAS